MALNKPDEGEIVTDDLDYNKIIEYIEEGKIRVPEFQREFVWERGKILDLLDSIYKGYPIGSVILWLTDKEFEYSSTLAESIEDSDGDKYFVIDGQQRLKSLFHAAKSKDINTGDSTKEVKVRFDLKEEKFKFADEIRNRKKSMYYIPNVKEQGMFFDYLEAIKDDSLSQFTDKNDLSDDPVESFLNALESLNLIYEDGGKYDLTQKGLEILEDKDKKEMMAVLVDNVQFVKDALELIKEEPGIERKEAKPEFQEIYGGSKNTAYHEFGKRCKWLRAIGLIYREGKGYYPEDEVDEILEMIEEIEKDIQKRYIPLNKILKGQWGMDSSYLESFSKERKSKIFKLGKNFSKYPFSLIIVNKEDWDEVCNIFERINTKGQHLTIVDLMMAKTWQGEEFNLRDELNDFKDETTEDIPDVTILKIVSMNILGKCTKRDILSISSKEFINHWEGSLESLRKSIDLLENDLDVPELSLLPYPDLLVPISHFYYKMSNGTANKWQKDRLKEWFWKASISHRFDSAVDSKLEEDKGIMADIINEELLDEDYTYPQKSIKDIMEQKYSLRNAFVKTVLCLYSNQKPKNIVNSSPITHDSFSKFESSEMHHIFPKNYLKEQDVEKKKINSIANIMFLPAKVNRGKEFRKAPSEYLGGIENENLEKDLESHLITNLEESGLLEDNFERFLRYRAKKIRDKLHQVSGEEEIFTGGDITPEQPFTNEMHIRNVIRQAKSYIYWEDKYFTRRGLEFLAQDLDTEDVNEVRILTGTEQTDHNLRKEFKKFKEEMENKGVDAEMHIMSKEDIRKIHDRWILDENRAFNIPSINTIGRGQHTEITETSSRPSFDEWWAKSTDIIKEWNEIQKRIN